MSENTNAYGACIIYAALTKKLDHILNNLNLVYINSINVVINYCFVTPWHDMILKVCMFAVSNPKGNINILLTQKMAHTVY